MMPATSEGASPRRSGLVRETIQHQWKMFLVIAALTALVSVTLYAVPLPGGWRSYDATESTRIVILPVGIPSTSQLAESRAIESQVAAHLASSGWLSDPVFEQAVVDALSKSGQKLSPSALSHILTVTHSGNVVHISTQSATPEEAARIERAVVSQLVNGGVSLLAQHQGVKSSGLLLMERGNGELSVSLDDASASAAKGELAIRIILGIAWGVLVAVTAAHISRSRRRDFAAQAQS